MTADVQTALMIAFLLAGMVGTHYTVHTMTIAVRSLAPRR